LFLIRVGIYTFLNLVVGSLFFQIPQNQSGIVQTVAVIIFLLAALNFTSLESIAV